MDVTKMGRAGLTGAQGRLAQRVAGPISSRTRMSREQIEAILGAILLSYGLYRFLRLMRNVWAAGREEIAEATG